MSYPLFPVVVAAAAVDHLTFALFGGGSFGVRTRSLRRDGMMDLVSRDEDRGGKNAKCRRA